MVQKIGPRELELRRMREDRFRAVRRPKATSAADVKKKLQAADNAAEARATLADCNQKAQNSRIGDEQRKDDDPMAKKTKAKKAKTTKAANNPRKNTKSAKAVALLMRPDGASGKDILKATGWPTISMPAFAKTQGLKLRKEKTENGLRYYGARG